MKLKTILIVLLAGPFVTLAVVWLIMNFLTWFASLDGLLAKGFVVLLGIIVVASVLLFYCAPWAVNRKATVFYKPKF